MKIGILAMVTPDVGGVYQYTNTLIETFIKFTDYNLTIYSYGKKCNDHLPNCHNVILKEESSTVFGKLKSLMGIYIPKVGQYIKFNDNIAILKQSKEDLILNPITSLMPYYSKKKYIVTIHDLQHKYYPQYFSKKELVNRHIIYKAASIHSERIICESDYVKNDIINFLDIDPDKIKIVPSPPPSYIDKNDISEVTIENIKKKYQLNNRYIFYPAQFWPHKNHLKLIDAIYYLKKEKNINISLILTGSFKNYYNNVFNHITKYGLCDQIRLLGYIPDQDLACIYKSATALVMPSLFESLSLPVWEAFRFGCPVACSNVCALPHQIADAGLLFNPHNVRDIADKILMLYNDKILRKKLIDKGFIRYKSNNLENYSKLWIKIIEKIDVRN